MGLVVAAMVHGYNRWAWARATFELPDGRYDGAIDALAVRYGNGASPARKALMTTRGYQRFDRVSVTFPPTLFERIGVGYTSAGGSVVAVEVDRATGAVAIVDAVDRARMRARARAGAGRRASGRRLRDGRRATRCTSICRSTRTAPATAAGISIATGCRAPPTFRSGTSKIDVLPPLGPTDVPKGIAELVMIPVVPAILNAIADATGKRFYALPVTAEKIKAALR